VIRRQDITEIRRQNALDAIALNKGFECLTADSPCDPATQANACVNKQFAQCVGGKFVLASCGAGLQCVSLPLVNKRGTSITYARISDALGTSVPKTVTITSTSTSLAPKTVAITSTSTSSAPKTVTITSTSTSSAQKTIAINATAFPALKTIATTYPAQKTIATTF
ncbi:6595_t:CDS:2, partial [Ambispora gerdemannii]